MQSTKKITTEDEGSLLLSTFYLLIFISFLILSLTGIIYNQLTQLQLTSQAYEAKALIEVSQNMLREKDDLDKIERAMLYFKQGEVQIKKLSEREYKLEARLNNAYKSSLTFSIPKEVKTEEAHEVIEHHKEIQDTLEQRNADEPSENKREIKSK